MLHFDPRELLGPSHRERKEKDNKSRHPYSAVVYCRELMRRGGQMME